MAGDTVITVIGNLTADPELRWTQSGAAVADFTVASTPRTYDRNAGEWRDGDTVTFDFPMPVRMLAANPLVSEDAGKVAFVRGPITFCAEEKDNGANLHLLHADVEALLADPSAAKVEEFDFHAGAKGIDDKGQGEVEDVTRRMVKLEVPAWREPLPAAVAAAGEGAAEVPAFAPLYAVYAPVKREPATATLIPYFAWANRGENEMTVWLRG